MITSISIKPVTFSVTQDFDKGDEFSQQFVSCTVAVGAGTSAGGHIGPLKAEASIGGSVAAEFDRTGLKDVVVKGSAGANVGTDAMDGASWRGVGVQDVSVEVGVEGKVSLISGKASAESTGILQGMFKK